MSLTATKPRKRIRPNHELFVARLGANLSPPGLARIAGVSAQTIRNAEKGHYIEPATQGRIARALGVTNSLDLFGLDRQRESL